MILYFLPILILFFWSWKEFNAWNYMLTKLWRGRLTDGPPGMPLRKTAQLADAGGCGGCSRGSGGAGGITEVADVKDTPPRQPSRTKSYWHSCLLTPLLLVTTCWMLLQKWEKTPKPPWLCLKDHYSKTKQKEPLTYRLTLEKKTEFAQLKRC